MSNANAGDPQDLNTVRVDTSVESPNGRHISLYKEGDFPLTQNRATQGYGLENSFP